MCGELCKIGKLVLRDTRIVIPKKLRQAVITLGHEGHLGIVGTKQWLRTKGLMARVDKEAECFCKQWHRCQIVSRPDPPEPVRSTPLPVGPWQNVALDFLGPLLSGHSALVVVDYYSRFFKMTIMKSMKTMTTDNGPQFISDVFQRFAEENRMEHHKVIARWAHANGEVERLNRSFEKRMRIVRAKGKYTGKEL